jgi:hemerythrin-like domain-containing protein
MYSLDELKNQNQEISQLCDVLSVLMEQPSLHNNPFVSELMKRFKEKVWVHLVFEDNTIYAALLHTGDEKTSNVAKAFHDSAKEIKHRFSGFVRHWCSMPESNQEREILRKESSEIFGLIRDRISYENEQIFPLVEKQK